jgi:hypothetical protein
LVTAGKYGYYECPYGEWRLFSDQDQGYRIWCSTLEPLRIGDYDGSR